MGDAGNSNVEEHDILADIDKIDDGAVAKRAAGTKNNIGPLVYDLVKIVDIVGAYPILRFDKGMSRKPVLPNIANISCGSI